MICKVAGERQCVGFKKARHVIVWTVTKELGYLSIGRSNGGSHRQCSGVLVGSLSVNTIEEEEDAWPKLEIL